MLTGIILAGGESRRMKGTNKSLLKFEYETLLQRQLRLMKTVCSELIIVTNQPRTYLQQVDGSVRIITDYIPQSGPLGGMHSGLSLAQNEQAWIVGCGMPFISPRAAGVLQELKRQGGWQAVIPELDGIPQPLHGIYDRSAAGVIGSCLHSGREMGLADLPRLLSCQTVSESAFDRRDLEKPFTFEIHTQDDYLSAMEVLEGNLSL